MSIVWSIKFQSLIGELKTLSFHLFITSFQKFQSLIGELKTFSMFIT